MAVTGATQHRCRLPEHWVRRWVSSFSREGFFRPQTTLHNFYVAGSESQWNMVIFLPWSNVQDDTRAPCLPCNYVPDCFLQRIHTKAVLIGIEFKSMAYIPGLQRTTTLKLRRVCCASQFSKTSPLHPFSVSGACFIFNLSFRTVSPLDWNLLWVSFPQLIQTLEHAGSPYSGSVVGTRWKKGFAVGISAIFFETISASVIWTQLSRLLIQISPVLGCRMVTSSESKVKYEFVAIIY